MAATYNVFFERFERPLQYLICISAPLFCFALKGCAGEPRRNVFQDGHPVNQERTRLPRDVHCCHAGLGGLNEGVILGENLYAIGYFEDHRSYLAAHNQQKAQRA